MPPRACAPPAATTAPLTSTASSPACALPGARELVPRAVAADGPIPARGARHERDRAVAGRDVVEQAHVHGLRDQLRVDGARERRAEAGLVQVRGRAHEARRATAVGLRL